MCPKDREFYHKVICASLCWLERVQQQPSATIGQKGSGAASSGRFFWACQDRLCQKVGALVILVHIPGRDL